MKDIIIVLLVFSFAGCKKANETSAIGGQRIIQVCCAEGVDCKPALEKAIAMASDGGIVILP